MTTEVTAPPRAKRTRTATKSKRRKSAKQLRKLPPPLHLIEILDAVAEREMPEEILESVVGKPLDEVTEEETPEILRTIATWEPDICF